MPRNREACQQVALMLSRRPKNKEIFVYIPVVREIPSLAVLVPFHTSQIPSGEYLLFFRFWCLHVREEFPKHKIKCKNKI